MLTLHRRKDTTPLFCRLPDTSTADAFRGTSEHAETVASQNHLDASPSRRRDLNCYSMAEVDCTRLR